VRWKAGDAELVLAANLSDSTLNGMPAPRGAAQWREGGKQFGGPWSVCWSIA